jgi:hypothetical protein
MRRTAITRGLLPALLLLAVVGACSDDGGDDPDTSAAAPAGSGDSEQDGGEVEALDVIFEDALLDDENGWGENEEETLSSQFVDDGYAITVEERDERFVAFADDGPLDVADTQVSATISQPGGATRQTAWGLMCRSQRIGSPRELYALTVAPDTGGWEISRVEFVLDGDTEVLASGTDPSLEGIGVDAPAELTATCLGDEGETAELSLAVDGTVVGEAEDADGLGAGAAGIDVTGGDEPSGEVIFSDFAVGGDEVDTDGVLFAGPPEENTFFDLNDTGGLTWEDGVTTLDTEAGGGTVLAGTAVNYLFPQAGAMSIALDGELDTGFAGVCVTSPTEVFELDVSADGYASIGRYPADGSAFEVLEEAQGVHGGTPLELTASWEVQEDGTTALHLMVDDEVVVQVDDAAIPEVTTVGPCASLDVAQPAGTPFAVEVSEVALLEG